MNYKQAVRMEFIKFILSSPIIPLEKLWSNDDY